MDTAHRLHRMAIALYATAPECEIAGTDPSYDGLQRFGLDQPFAILQEERVHARVGGVNAAGTE